MTTPDTINGAFEALAGLAVLNHCRILIKQRMVRGVSVLSTALFMLWGFYNLYFYPHLEQWASWYGGILVTSANVLWVALLVYFRHREKKAWEAAPLTVLLK